MNSGGSGSTKSPSTPEPKGSTTTPYGNATPFDPQWVSFLPDEMGPDGRLPMATGLDESHLAAIRDRAPPPPLAAQPRATKGTGDLTDRDVFAKMMAEYNQEKMFSQFMNNYISASNPGGPRGVRRKGGDPGGYASSSRSAADRAGNPGGLY